MKVNLKNKPVAIAGKRNKTLTPFGWEVNKWFNDFERELRGILNADFSPCNSCVDHKGDCRVCIKQILGDEE